MIIIIIIIIIIEIDLDNLLQKKYIQYVTSQILIQSDLFGRSLNTSLCEIYDHKAAFLLVKTVLHKISISLYGKAVPIL